MFEFTALGAIVLGTGLAYLMLVGHRLLPARIKPQEDLAEESSFRQEKLPVALSTIGLVVGLAALEVVPIMVSALGGIVAMVSTGCVRPNEVYEAVDWSVIFLLAGLIPLGMAVERSGTAAYLATAITGVSDMLPPLALLFVFYVVTPLVTQVVSNNASVILMIPMAVEAAEITGRTRSRSSSR